MSAIEVAGISELRALRRRDPVSWLALVHAVIESAPHLGDAARTLGIAHRTLQSWVQETPALSAGIKLAPVGRPRTLSPERVAQVLRAVDEHGSINAAAVALGVAWGTVNGIVKRYGTRAATKGV